MPGGLGGADGDCRGALSECAGERREEESGSEAARCHSDSESTEGRSVWREWTTAFLVSSKPDPRRGERGESLGAVFLSYERQHPHFGETQLQRRRRPDAGSCWRSEETRGVTWISEKG